MKVYVCIYQLPPNPAVGGRVGGVGLPASMPAHLRAAGIPCGNVAWQVAGAGADVALGDTRIVLSDVQDIRPVGICTFKSQKCVLYLCDVFNYR